MMTLSRLRRLICSELNCVCGDCAAYDADLLIKKAYRLTPSQLITRSNELFDEAPAMLLAKRRISGEPTQYILGEWEFYGLEFYVGEGVLIPRQDTEALVERALSLIADVKSPRVLELCSGTGCIAVALKKQRPDALITAVELYDEALCYLKRNSQRNNAELEIRKFDVLQCPIGFGEYDLIVSNPPYITLKAMHTLQTEVRREPASALYGGEDGLEFYRAIAEKWLPLLSDVGSLAVEIGYDQAKAVLDIFEQYGVSSKCEQDLTGLDRVIYGTVTRL